MRKNICRKWKTNKNVKRTEAGITAIQLLFPVSVLFFALRSPDPPFIYIISIIIYPFRDSHRTAWLQVAYALNPHIVIHCTAHLEEIPATTNLLPATLHLSFFIEIIPGITNIAPSCCHTPVRVKIIIGSVQQDPFTFCLYIFRSNSIKEKSATTAAESDIVEYTFVFGIHALILVLNHDAGPVITAVFGFREVRKSDGLL